MRLKNYTDFNNLWQLGEGDEYSRKDNVFIHFGLKMGVDFNPISPKSDQYQISPCSTNVL